MFRAVDRANLTIHSLDPSGLVNVSPATRASSTLRGGQVSAAILSAANDNLQRQGDLRVLPERTGGRAVMNTNGPDSVVPEIFRESDSYYLIGFRPADPSPNGKFHQITVKTTRRGLDVHARSGYTARAAAERAGVGSAAVSEPVRAALTGLLPASATPLDVNAATFAVPGARTAAVVLTIGVKAFAELAAGAPAVGGAPLEIVASAFDRGGRPKGIARQTLELSWPASVSAQDQALRRALASRPAAWRVRDSCRRVLERRGAAGERLLLRHRAGLRGSATVAVEHHRRRYGRHPDGAQGLPLVPAADRADDAARVRTGRSTRRVFQDLSRNEPHRSPGAGAAAILNRRRSR